MDFPEIEWFWGDFYIINTICILLDQSINKRTYYEIISEFLEPFEQWFKQRFQTKGWGSGE